MFLTLNLNIGIFFWCFWDLDFLDLESSFSDSPNKAVHKSVYLYLMDFQLHAQSDKSTVSFISAFQALFSCGTCLSNK